MAGCSCWYVVEESSDRACAMNIRPEPLLDRMIIDALEWQVVEYHDLMMTRISGESKHEGVITALKYANHGDPSTYYVVASPPLWVPHPFQPSSEIADAWKLVERMHHTLAKPSIRAVFLRSLRSQVECAGDIWSLKGPSLARMICIAFLVAAGHGAPMRPVVQ